MPSTVRFVRGDWQPRKLELVKPSVTTKLCFFAAVALTLIPDHDLIYLIIIGVFLTVKISGVVNEPLDPFKPIEGIFFGLLKTMSLEAGHIKDD